ncbi:MAG: hypothetical protein J5643_03760 [Lachnospiraceae bacterium]|nr:hypothetical protein [Lachnospiraceae bacterium]
MKKRTTIEMTLSRCPSCGVYTKDFNGICPCCGASMTVSESFTKEYEEGIMPEAAPIQYPTLRSTFKNYSTFTVNSIVLFVILTFTCLNMFVFHLAATSDFKSALLSLIMMFFVLLIFGLCYIIDFISYLYLKRRGRSIKGIILGYNTVRDPHDNGEPYYSADVTVQMQVFARIHNKDMIVFVIAPDGVNELTHPRGTEVTLFGYADKYTVEL